ncbi:C-GCAxxG-C-C family protein [Dorea longicatena]|uniref:C-GCAxxG-C-C family protein n=1 Tax=Dorea longicatena TaxID=88431 RepID=UPI00189C24CD|nr:C-GCAxxG-C-C family protein [Dorea longicatena]
MNKADKAESLFRTGYNCSQSVYAVFAEELGITVEEAAKKASPFGAGFGKLREVCGAVTGMVMVIGDLYGYDDPKDAAGKKKLYALVQKLCGAFEESEGSLICRELLGLEKGEDLEEPAVRTEEYYQSRPCVKACRRAAEILEEYVKEQKRK